MRIESLEYFFEVARCGSFTQAANHLFISQQGLSRAVKALEDDLGTALFKRVGKRVSLTQAGETLIPYAQQIIGSAEDMRKALTQPVSEDAMSIPGGVEIVITPFVSNVILNLMTEEVNRWGLAEAMFTERSLDELIHELAIGKLDGSSLALIPENEVSNLTQSSDVTFNPLFSLEIVAICPTNLISPRRRTLTLKELSDLPLAYNSELVFSRTIEHMTRQIALNNVVLVSSNLQTIDRAVAQGRACALSDSLVAYLRDAAPDTVTCSVKGAERALFGILEAKEKTSSDAQYAYIERFSSMIRKELQAYIKQYPV